MKQIRTDYLGTIFDPSKLHKKTISASKKILKYRDKLDFEAIAFTGISGAGLAIPVSAQTKISLLAIRKKSDNSHSYYTVEGNVGAKRYIIIDDLIDTGKTVNKIIKKLKRDLGAECVGIFLYNGTAGYKDWNGIPLYSL